MSEFEILDPRMGGLALAYAQLDHLWSGARWLEGPAYFAAGRYLLFSDIPNDRMLRYDETNGVVSVFRAPSDNTTATPSIWRAGSSPASIARGASPARSMTAPSPPWRPATTAEG